MDQLLPELMVVLHRPPLSDLSNEINSTLLILIIIVFTINCLTTLMDIFQNIGGAVVAHGGVKSVTEILERTMGFIDLNETCIKFMEKISMENPNAILTSGAIPMILNMMDFFENSTQKKILNLIHNVSKNIGQESELNDHLIPVLPGLTMLLQTRGDHAQGKIEIFSNICLRTCESIFRLFNPISNQT